MPLDVCVCVCVEKPILLTAPDTPGRDLHPIECTHLVFSFSWKSNFLCHSHKIKITLIHNKNNNHKTGLFWIMHHPHNKQKRRMTIWIKRMTIWIKRMTSKLVTQVDGRLSRVGRKQVKFCSNTSTGCRKFDEWTAYNNASLSSLLLNNSRIWPEGGARGEGRVFM